MGNISTLTLPNNTKSGIRAVAIPFGSLDSTSTSTVMTATVPGIFELSDGVCCYIKNGVVTSASGFTLNVNNLGAKPVYNSMAAATRITTTFNVNYTFLFVYNSTRVSGGCWDMYYGYNTNTTYSDMTAATASAAGTHGLVPAPAAGKQTSFLRGDGTWVVPTNTLNTAGSTDSSSKLFLIGATSQAANPQTYSHDTAYVGTDGHVYSNSKQVVNLSDTQALTNKTYNGYTLGNACALTYTVVSTF